MAQRNFYNMVDFCTEIKNQIEFYNKNGLNITLYGNVANELLELTGKPDLETQLFFLKLGDLLGKISRVIDAPYPNWVGGEEVFSNEKFIETMKLV